MKKNLLYIFLFFTLVGSSCKKDFLDRMPLDKLTDETYWTSENNVRTFAWGFYPAYFVGYASSYSFGPYFSGQTLNDDFAPSTPTPFATAVPTSGGGWTFSWVRKANIMIDRVGKVPMSDEAKKHWTGIGRFFRGMEYSDLVNKFGDVPYYNKPLEETSPDLYKARDPRTLVMDSVLADFRYAAENVRASDGTQGLTVNKYVVLAFMSRIFLFEGTWQKYHAANQAKATEYLEAAKWAANEVITKGGYSVAADYRGLFSSVNLAGNPETILYRSYETAMLTHSLMSYSNGEPQSGPSKDAIDSYLASDGRPISVSENYTGDKTITEVLSNRDPRINATFASDLRLLGINGNYSTSGISQHKFLNEELKGAKEGSSNLNITDAPIIRLGEVMLNYAEAAAELGTLTQADLDLTINKLRDRAGYQTKLPALQVVGDQPAVNGVVYDDPNRDPSVPSLIWEIRRERRVELMMEGFRLDDLRRWKKLDYTDTQTNPDVNLGLWISKADYPNTSAAIDGGGTEGYIKPSSQGVRTFADSKVYLSPLPIDQIKLYKDQGVTLSQNPGWE